jgi:hypothetical protein
MELMLPNLGTIGYLCKNFRFLKVGTGGSQPGNKRLHQGKELPVPRPETYRSQPGNHRLPLQATAGSQQLELMFPNLGTIGYHCKELPVPRGWNYWFPTSEPNGLQLQASAGYRRMELMLPDLGTTGYHCKELLVQEIKISVSKLRGNHFKELRVPKVGNSLFQE